MTVITAPYEKSDIRGSGFLSKQQLEGIELIIVNTADNNRKSKLHRAITSLLFAVVSCCLALTRKYDILIASSGPITVGFPLLLSKKIRKKKTIFETRDLWPGGAIESGLIKNFFLVKLFYFLEKKCYENADLVVCASSGQKEDIIGRFPDLNPIVIPNASDNSLFGVKTSGELPEMFRKKKLLTHVGSLGFIHNVGYWLDVAKSVAELAPAADIVFVFIGEGADREMLERKVKEEKIMNVFFLGLKPKKDLPLWIQNSYATLFATLSTKTQDASSPNKIFDSFAAGVPIIQTSSGWIRELVCQNECGINVPIDKPEVAARLTLEYLQDQERRDFHSKKATFLANTVFDRDRLALEYYTAIESCLRN